MPCTVSEISTDYCAHTGFEVKQGVASFLMTMTVLLGCPLYSRINKNKQTGKKKTVTLYRHSRNCHVCDSFCSKASSFASSAFRKPYRKIQRETRFKGMIFLCLACVSQLLVPFPGNNQMSGARCPGLLYLSNCLDQKAMIAWDSSVNQWLLGRVIEMKDFDLLLLKSVLIRQLQG